MLTAIPAPLLPLPAPVSTATVSLPEAWDDDVRERMIVERAMRPRSWEPEGRG